MRRKIIWWVARVHLYGMRHGLWTLCETIYDKKVKEWGVDSLSRRVLFFIVFILNYFSIEQIHPDDRNSRHHLLRLWTLNVHQHGCWRHIFFRFRHHMHKLKTTVESKMMGDYRREREIPFRLRLLILGWLLSHLHVWYHPSMNSYFIAIEWTQDFPLC